MHYVWQRPSTGKLGYVIPLERWGWMIGTGIYLENVESTLARIDAQVAANIDRTVMWIGVIALVTIASSAACAAVLNISEHRSADVKLKRLARQVVESQKQERARLSRELHDGISQMLVSVKLLLESALLRFGPDRMPKPRSRRVSGVCRARCAKCAASRMRCVPPCSTISASPPRSNNWHANSTDRMASK